ncbi:hypothetical protein B0H13DRAFT_2310933 [Mycena leptocephala]|nr:hypothetical protein B0H13DRAFT_2310933 [Mycena leptocephala]
MSEAPALPQELFDLIIDHLFDDVESLRACALVSSNFLPSSRAHIFSHLKVGPIDHEHSIDELREILARSPTLLLTFMGRGMACLACAWGSTVFAHPRSLQRLAITIESGFVHWANTSKALRTSIHLTLSMQTLTCLKEVILKWVTFDERDNLDFGATLVACAGSPLTQIAHLSIDLDTRVLELLSRWILLPESPLKLTHLTSLACTLDGKFDHITLQRLLDCAPNLQHLRLKNGSGRALALNDLVHLRTLCIDTLAPLEPRVRWLASSIIFPPQPVSLVINMMSESGSPEVVQLAAADAGWGNFDPLRV